MQSTHMRKRLELMVGISGAVLLLVAVAPSVTRQPAGWPQDGERDSKQLSEQELSDIVVPVKGEAGEHTQARRRMIAGDLAGRDITDKRVLEAMGKIPRHEFVPNDLGDAAYADHPLPIGHEQTISQPYIVALMTQLAGVKEGSRALDIGTGSGYQAAVLAEICKEVYSIEIVEPLAKEAKKRLADLGYENVTVRHGDGYQGWPEKAPFDVIIVAAAPDHVPQPLIDQLAPGGKLVIPVGKWYQELLLIERDKDGNVHQRRGIGVRFVPMTGEAQKRE